jgi:GTP-binding protein
MSKPLVLIVGKPNVGKSTLFNRIIGEKKAIVLDQPGVTRDHIYGEARWEKRAFTLVDTCGIFEDPEEIIAKQQKEVVINSIKEASLVIFVVDGRNGVTSEDFHIANFLRKAGVDVLIVANKAESYEKYKIEIKPDLYEFGFGEAIPVSAEHNGNIEELMDETIKRLEAKGYDLTDEEILDEKGIIKVAIIGKPNSGKSSLFNKILGMEKAIVSDIPGTTRDAVDEIIEIDGQKFKFMDTAGMRRKKNVEYGSIEMYSIIRTTRTIEKSDIVVILVDALEGITQQDKKIAGIAENRGKGTIVAYNKWDLVDHSKVDMKAVMQSFEKEMYFIYYSPLIFTSAVDGTGVPKLIDYIKRVQKSREFKIQTSVLNSALERHLMVSPPPVRKGKRIKFYYATQVGVKPPVFTFYTNQPKEISNSYKQSLRNMIRKYIDPFEGSPLFLKFEERRK